MTEQEIQSILAEQRAFFLTGASGGISHRLQALDRLEHTIKRREPEIEAALKADLGKSSFESYMSEISMVLDEIHYMKKHLASLARPKRVHTPAAQFAAQSFVLPSPYGTVLIMSPWNYPFLLSFSPLVDAVAAGNTVVLKPSAYSPASSQVIRQIVQESFAPQLVQTVTGGRAENTCLLQQHFDYIFFTGSQAVGKEVMRQAALRLTPVTLELGGKSPCIVDRTADLRLAAKRIVFGKYLNCGQTCVAPDYVYCDASIRDALVQEIKKQIRLQYGSEPLKNPDYGKIVNEKHFDRIIGLIQMEKVVWGGKFSRASLQIEPTVMQDTAFSDPVMQEEIFGPLLPVLTFRSLKEAAAKINSLPHPLALYHFTRDKAAARYILRSCGFGGGCVNDTIIHLATPHMGFGGFGESGMGAYHGAEGFRTFSHCKSIVDKKLWIDLPLRYQPYTRLKERLLRYCLR